MSTLPDYIFVNEDGHIYNKKTGKQLNEIVHTTSGLLCVSIKTDGSGWHQRYIHRLIAEKYVPNPEPEIKTNVIHLDGDPTNNVPSNLKWMSNSEFMVYKHEHGTYKDSLDKLNKRRAKPLIAIDPLIGRQLEFGSITEAACWCATAFGDIDINCRQKLIRALKRKAGMAFGLEWRYK